MSKLADAYHRYHDLQEEHRKCEQRIKRLVPLLYPKYIPQTNEMARLGHVMNDMDFAPGIEDLFVWEILEEYLVATGETPIADAIEILSRLKKKAVTRQAVESAIRRHPDKFIARQVNEKRFISLK